MDWNEFAFLIQRDPEKAIDKAYWLVSRCSSTLKELQEEEDENDWRCYGHGALLESCEESGKTPDDHSHIYPEIPGIPSVTLQILETTYYIPLNYAIKEVAGHFEEAVDICIDCQTCLGRGASDTAIELWSSFDKNFAKLQALVEPSLPELEELTHEPANATE
jgi:hypothetical protein